MNFLFDVAAALSGILIMLFSIAGLIYFVYIGIVYKVWCWLPGTLDQKLIGKKFKWVVYGTLEKYYDDSLKSPWWKTRRNKFIFRNEEHAIKKIKKHVKNINTKIFVVNLTFDKENEELDSIFYHFPYISCMILPEKYEEIFSLEQAKAINSHIFIKP